MFGHEPRSNSSFWKIVGENEIIDEENLSTPVADSIDDAKEDAEAEADVDACANIIDDDIIRLVEQLSNKVVANSLVDHL